MLTESNDDVGDPSFTRPKIRNAKSRVAKLCRDMNDSKAAQSNTNRSESQHPKPKRDIANPGCPELFGKKDKPK